MAALASRCARSNMVIYHAPNHPPADKSFLHQLAKQLGLVRLDHDETIRPTTDMQSLGGLNPSFKAGDLMVIADHISFMPSNPLRGPNDDAQGPRFPDMVGTYTEELRALAHSVDPDLREGIYVAVPGPNFETPAELRMLRGWGADAVGMSTVPEVLVARHAGMRILAISTVTDMATGIPGQIEHVHHEDVLAVANAAGQRLARLVTAVVARL